VTLENKNRPGVFPKLFGIKKSHAPKISERNSEIINPKDGIK
jgi:hypothetical protein